MTNDKFKLLAGPCVIESEENVLFLAQELKKIAQKLDLDFYFKASWDKANRTKATNYRGPGLEEGLRILEKAKNGPQALCSIGILQSLSITVRWLS